MLVRRSRWRSRLEFVLAVLGVRVAGLVSALLYGFADLPRTWGGRVAFLVLAPPLTLLLEVLGERMLAIVVLLGPLLWWQLQAASG